MTRLSLRLPDTMVLASFIEYSLWSLLVLNALQRLMCTFNFHHNYMGWAHTLQARWGNLGTGRFSRHTQLLMTKLEFESRKLVAEVTFSAATSSHTLASASSECLLSLGCQMGTGLEV